MPSGLRRHDESGHIHFVTVCCDRRLQFFRHDNVKSRFLDAMRYVRDKLKIRWIGYVIMPEHTHFFVLPQARGVKEPTPISLVLHDLKGVSGRWCKEALRDVWRQHKSLGLRPLDDWATGDGEKPFWKPRGYDFNVFDESKVIEKLNYIHRNPVRRGLVDNPRDWPWSSFGWYEMDERQGLIEMDWDGTFPIAM